MKTEDYPNSLLWTAEQTSLAEVLEKWEEICKNCNPLTPIACVTNCRIWRQKNEFRRLYDKIKNPSYLTKLLNTLKNKRRLHILDIISRGRYSTAKLQQELKNSGYRHSQQTIVNEYLTPLIEVGLVEENQESQYHSTLFGCRLKELTKDSYDMTNILPPHSECYEETALSMLTQEPKTFEDLECIVPRKSVARILGRLQKAGLIETSKENDYVFYFITKRNPNEAKFSSTERRVYENIIVEGVSARKLAEKTEISLRRTYKYLRKLKGKKLVFTRKKPKSYSLTTKGHQVAEFLNWVHNLTTEIQATALPALKNESHKSLMLDTYQTKSEKEKKIIPLATTITKRS
jgi:predicted transcriptional regulator